MMVALEKVVTGPEKNMAIFLGINSLEFWSVSDIIIMLHFEIYPWTLSCTEKSISSI